MHQLKPSHPNRHAKPVGRGGKRGKTSGRGTKGQKARAGHKIRPEFRDVIMRIPKLRGYRFKSFQSEVFPVSLDVLEKSFSDGDTVTPASLIEKGIVSLYRGAVPKVKILSDGNLTKKLKISDCGISQKAKAKVEKSGGEIIAK